MICHCDTALIYTHTRACRIAPALLGVAGVLFVFACLAETSSLSSALMKCSRAKRRPPLCQHTRNQPTAALLSLHLPQRLLCAQAFQIQSGCNYLTSPLLEFDFDEQNKANQRHDHEESQEDTHVEVLRGLLWKRTTQSCQRI